MNFLFVSMMRGAKLENTENRHSTKNDWTSAHDMPAIHSPHGELVVCGRVSGLGGEREGLHLTHHHIQLMDWDSTNG